MVVISSYLPEVLSISDRILVARLGRIVAEFDAAAAVMKNVAALYAPGGGRKREYRDHRLEWMLKSGGLEIVTQGLRDDNIRFSWPDPA